MTELKALYDLDTEVLEGYSHSSLDNRELRLDRELLQRDGMKECRRKAMYVRILAQVIVLMKYEKEL